jgi:phage terminase small subunit
MLQLLKDIAMGRVDASPTQVKAAIAAVAYTHQKPGDAGKKEQRQTEAESIASGKFGARQPPKLVASR